MILSRLVQKILPQSIILLVVMIATAHAVDHGVLKHFCDSDSVTHYFYSKDGSEDISYVVAYHKRLKKNIMERSLKSREGNQLFRAFKDSSKMGMSVRCEQVDHYL